MNLERIIAEETVDCLKGLFSHAERNSEYPAYFLNFADFTSFRRIYVAEKSNIVFGSKLSDYLPRTQLVI